MKFKVSDLKMLNKMVLWANTDDERLLTKDLKKSQPGFHEEIDDVAIDPRCLDASRFCTLFCSLALERAELISEESLPAYPRALFRDMACLVAQRDARLGKRELSFPDRIQRHVLSRNDFDDGDSAWLRTTLSSFLIILETSSTYFTDDEYL